ncbi:hypothetical protein [Streptomyces sp. NPDC007100]|uniref:hypothetical protein n=1 Tax=Streptomyces sp. NPDC007100 TaxID=3155602 RepID=UPI0033D667DF
MVAGGDRAGSLPRPQQIDHRAGGRGVYVSDPDGHAIEFLTRTLTVSDLGTDAP